MNEQENEKWHKNDVPKEAEDNNGNESDYPKINERKDNEMNSLGRSPQEQLDQDQFFNDSVNALNEAVQAIYPDENQNLQFENTPIESPAEEPSIELTPEEILKQKIQHEKRVRHQLYSALNYQLSLYSDFDFYSADAFNVLKFSQILAKEFGDTCVTEKTVLLAFILLEVPSQRFLKQANISFETYKKEMLLRSKQRSEIIKKEFLRVVGDDLSEKTVLDVLINAFEEEVILDYLPHLINYYNYQYGNPLSFVKHISKKIQKTAKKLDARLDQLLIKWKVIKPTKEDERVVPFSNEVIEIFDWAYDAAVKRFKTPVITTEILFLGLMENSYKKDEYSTLNNFFASPTDFHLLRYKLFKEIHFQETSLRNLVPKNQHFFAYLLKTQFPEEKINHLLHSNYFARIVEIFRDDLMKKVVAAPLSSMIYEDTIINIRMTSKRVYSDPEIEWYYPGKM